MKHMTAVAKGYTPTEMLSKPSGDYSVDSAAEELEVCKATIWNLIKKGDLKTDSVGRARRIFRQSMADYKFSNAQ